MTATFSSLDEFRAALQAAKCPDAAALAGAAERNGQLTKPAGSLGRLEELAIWYAGWRGQAVGRDCTIPSELELRVVRRAV